MSATRPMTATPNRSKSEQSPVLAPDALAALHHAGLSRRAFLRGADALVISFSARGLVGTALAQGRGRGGAVDPTIPNPAQLDSWLAIDADGAVTAYTGKVELGQGISTAQIQLIAEELGVSLDRVKLVAGDTAMTPDQGITSGSQSSPTNFNNGNLALAGATARQALLKMASQRLSVPVDQLSVANGIVSVKADSSKQVTYGQLIAGRKFELTLDQQAKRKPHAEWIVLGKPARRPDMPALVTGQFEFVHNVRLPGMLHGRMVRPPAVGATVVSVDESSVASVPGLVKVVVKKNWVGVVARKPWQAIQAANELKVNWSSAPGLPGFAGYYDYMRNQKPTRDTLFVDSKDVEQKLTGAATVVKATYFHPFQMHGSIGSSCAVADVKGDQATIYSPTQGAWNQRSCSAMVLGLQPQNVRVIFKRGSGCYGCNGADTVTFDAALLSQAVQAPVRVQFTRKDEMAWGENYGLPFVMDERAALDAQGNIIAWDHEAWSAVLGNRPGNNQPGNVVSGYLMGYEPAAFAARSPAPDPQQFDNGNNSVPSYFAGVVGGQSRGTGTIKSERSLLHNVPSPFFTAPLRSPARLQNTFAHESFMDELAARAKADPLAFRLRHLSDPRLRDVVNEAAQAFKWDARPSPKAGLRKAGAAIGRGMSCVLYEGDNGYASMFCEVEVDQGTGAITVRRIVVSNDSGPISNPDGLKNQMEGGALQGLSRALGEEVTWDAQQITSVDWRSYHSLPVGFSVPAIEVVLLDRPEHATMGAGETSITLVASAVGNAVFDATGARLRQVPFTPARVKAALAQRS
jgi:nicotinate dehydrogenase subunit B